MKDRLQWKFYAPPCQFFNVEKEEGSDQQKSWITCIEDPDRKMIHHIACIANVKDAEGKSNQQDGKKNISPAFSRSFIIDQQYNKYPQDNAAIN